MRKKHKIALVVLQLIIVIVTIHYFNKEKTKLKEEHAIRQRRFSYVTRDPNRLITFSYQTSINQSMSHHAAKVDLANGLSLTMRQLDRQMVIVLGFGTRSMYKGLGCVASIQSHMPFKKIIVYDLGIHPKMVKKLRQMCNVEVRKVNFSKYPKHVRKTENHAWQVLELASILREYGAFFYIEPDMRLRAPISMLLPYIVKQNGVLMDVGKHSALSVTHPDVFPAINLSLPDFKKDFPNAPIGTKFIAAVNTSTLWTDVWRPMVTCALNWKCIAPHGSDHKDVEPKGTTHTHRYEFSVLTLLLYKKMGNHWLPNNDTNAMIQKLYHMVDPDFSHDYMWAHYCNPPQNEIDCLTNEKKCN